MRWAHDLALPLGLWNPFLRHTTKVGLKSAPVLVNMAATHLSRKAEVPLSKLVHDRYEAQVREGRLDRDAAQEAIVHKLDELRERLRGYRRPKKAGALGWLLGAKPSEPIKGLYIWGSVGGGKTMLMDFFFQEAQIPHKKRIHFHAFMADVHARVHEWRQLKKHGKVSGDDPIAPVADKLADEAWLLCFDEFAVTDIADAMILGRLFEALFARGVVVVATSNVDPVDLYKDGLNRALFMPFIGMVQSRMDVLRLDAKTDYRMEKLAGSPVYHVPADALSRVAIDKVFKALTGVDEGSRHDLPHLGRLIYVPEAAGGVARFHYNDICGRPLGASDFLVIAQEFHTIIIEDIPALPFDKRNEVKRFINLVDAFYDQHVKLIVSAAAPPVLLYTATEGREAFEFERTVSRLNEMQSEDYIALPHGAATSQASGVSSGIVET